MKLRNFLLASAIAVASSASAATAVTPASGGTANPFAYALSSTSADGIVTINYSLNADATAVAINLIGNQGTVVKTVDLEGDFLKKGAHTTTVELAGLSDGCYNWEVKVTGAAKTAVTEFTALRFYHPRGVDVDNNMESPAFGNIYVTEGMVTTSNTYWSGTRGGNGLYIFTPDMQGVENAVTATEGDYAFMGGFTVDQKVASGSTTNGADLARVRVAEDGRIFVTRCNDSGSYIAVVQDVATLIAEDKFTSLLGEGSVDASTYAFNNTSGTFVAGPNIGFDIKGSGTDLKIMAISAQSQLWSYSWKGSRIDEYSLGSASVLPTPVQQSVLTEATTAPQTTNVEYDNRGGFWYCQSRQTPSETNVGLAYVDADGNIKYTDLVPRGGGGIRLSPDCSQIAIASNYASNSLGTSTFSVYDITWAEDGTPSLTEIYTITHGIGTNCYDIAWDLANNIYICGNSKEYLKGFSLPRASNDFTTKAAAQYSICYTAPAEPTVATLYAVGAGDALGAWDPANAVEFTYADGVYTLELDETASEFKISTAKGDWTTFNAGNLTPDAALTNGGTVNLSVNAEGGNIVLPWAGVWTITVAADLSTLTATTETPQPTPSYPDAVYMVGHNGAWDPSAPFEITGENGVYTAEAVVFTNTTFKLSTGKGEWDTDFNPNGLNVASNPVAIGEAVALTTGWSGDITIATAGTYDVTIDLVNNTLTLSGAVSYPEAIYAIGNVNGYNWSTANGVALNHIGDGVYEGSVTIDDSGNGYGYFQFATTISDKSDDWATINAGTRYGALTEDEAIETDVATSMTNNWAGGTQSWKIAAKEYKMTVDIVNCTVTVSSSTGIEAIESVDANASAVYYNLQGVEVTNPQQGNIYIVKRGNKVTKEVK